MAISARTEVFDKVTRDVFQTTIKPRARPAILRGLVRDWPAVAAGRTSPAAFCAYLKPFCSGASVPFFEGPPEIAGRFFYNERLDGFNFEPRKDGLDQLLDRLMRHLDDPRPPSFYAGSLAIPAYVPGFNRDNSIAALIPASAFMESIWIGNRTVIAPHYDNTENIACCVAGRRRFTLFPTAQYRNLYVGPLDLTPAGQAISLVDTRAPDLDRFPLYAEAMAAAEIAELEAGDALYLPTLWWHGVESLTAFGVLVNYWWRDVPAYFESGFHSLLHCALSVKDLPAPQRAAWKVIFDHLIFQTDGPPLDHLPKAARGLFGELTAGTAARIRAYLAKTLER